MASDDSEKLIPALNATVIRTESPSKKRKDLLLRIGAALFYGVASFMIMVVNKHVLTVHKFPSFQVRIMRNYCLPDRVIIPESLNLEASNCIISFRGFETKVSPSNIL